jgi:hypothetical protein
MVLLTACVTQPHKSAELPGPPVQASTEAVDWLLSNKYYIDTIALIQKEIRKGVDEEILGKEYLQAANACLSRADTLIKDGHDSEAGLLLKIVQDSYPQSPKLQGQIAASPAQIKVKIDLCTDKLMAAGLLAYRSGELASAINIWQQVLAFDPHHQAAQNFLQTTQQQLAKLKALNSTD